MGNLDNLNEAQRAAVEAGPGPVLVLSRAGQWQDAGAHSPYRLPDPRSRHRALAYYGCDLYQQSCTRDATPGRLSMLGGKSPWLDHGHFSCNLRSNVAPGKRESARYDGNFLIFDTADQRQVTKQALQDLGLDDKKFSPNRMLSGISNAKNELVTPEQYAASNYISEITRRVYQRYQEILVANNAMDFDDLLMNAVLLLDDRPDVLERYQQKYNYILVDEFQDTNTAQYA